MSLSGSEGQLLPVLFVNSANCLDAGITLVGTAFMPSIETNQSFNMPIKMAAISIFSVMAWHSLPLRKIAYVLGGILLIVFAWNLYCLNLKGFW